MKISLQFILWFSIGFVGCNGSKPSKNAHLTSFVDSLFQESVDTKKISGASILVFHKGNELINKSYGYAHLETTSPMPDNPIFEIGSVTKQFTAVAILKLIEQKKLRLTDDFTKYLAFDTKGREITIRHLLNHTSGIIGYTELPEFQGLMGKSINGDSVLKMVEREELQFEPGEIMIYSNSAYYFLGMIIEEITGLTYEEYVTLELLEPLEMNDTYFCSDSIVVNKKVNGYEYTMDALQPKVDFDYGWAYSAGALCSTTNDLLKWMKAMHNGTLLSKVKYHLLTSPVKLNNGSKTRYGMGLSNYQNFGHHEIGHGGAIPGFLSQTSYFPEEDLYIICLVNTIGPKGADYFVNEITWDILAKKQFQSVAIDLNLEKLTGTYKGMARGGEMSIEIGSLSDQLTTQTNGQSKPKKLETYVGNSTWMRGNNTFTFTGEKLILDNIYGHYILNKQ